MTEIEETIKILKEMFPKGLCEVDEYKMAQVAINALEKQIAKKPIPVIDKTFGIIYSFMCRIVTMKDWEITNAGLQDVKTAVKNWIGVILIDT